MGAALGEVADDLHRQVEKLRDKRIGKQREGAPSIRHLEAEAEVPGELERLARSTARARPGAAAVPRRYPAAHGSAGESAEHR